MTALLTDNLPLLAGAPNGIKRLRELILELAVRGKLLPQDPNDEPARELLKRIAKEKAQLELAGQIRKQKPLSEIAEEEQPFELPAGWAWARLADIAFSQAGFAFKSNGFNQAGLGLPLIRIRDVGQAFSGTYYEGDYRPEFLVQRGDYLISMDGEFRVAAWEGEASLLNQRVSRLVFFGEEIARRFIADSLQARLLELQGVKAYTTVDHLSGGQISESVIALPPLAGQHRIVAKVDELMALCDRLEAQQAYAESDHTQLVQALLDSLTQASDATDFATNWQRLAEHFHTLFTTEPSIDALKQTLLQLALTGKLTSSEILRHLPIQDIARLIDGDRGKNYPKPHDYLPEGYCLFLSTKNVRDGCFEFNEKQFISEEKHKTLRSGKLERGDVVITTRGTLGNTAWYSDLVPYEEIRINSGMLIIRCNSEIIYQAFLLKYLQSPVFGKQLKDMRTGSAQPQIPAGILKKFLIPIFSTQEQHRIVAKVDQLMALCDQLKTRLTQARQLNEQLATALVEKAVA